MVDVVDLIMADHREVERLFDVLEKHPDQRALQLPVLSALLIAQPGRGVRGLSGRP